MAVSTSLSMWLRVPGNLGNLPAGGGLALAPLAQTAGVTCLSHCQWRFEESGTGHGENRDLTPGKPGPPSQGRPAAYQ